MIRSSKHTLKFLNSGKLLKLHEFIEEYRFIFNLILNNIWEYGYEDFCPSKDKLENCPRFLDYRRFKLKTNLSARVLRTLTTQLCGVLKGAIKKRATVQYLLKNNKINVNKAEKLFKKHLIVKPNIENLKLEINSICCEIVESNGEFNSFLVLKSLGKYYGKIPLPVKNTKVSNKWRKLGKRLNSVLLDGFSVSFRFEIEKSQPDNLKGRILGIDQGFKNVATLSDGQVTPKTDTHGHSLESIINKLSRKKKGSKAFGKTQEHRENFVNWSINQLDFTKAKEVRLEKIRNINYKKRCSRKMSHWLNTLIRDKIKRRCEELDVPVFEQDSSYRSQRCFRCGIVRKANRRGQIYKCKHCGHEDDSDHNASLNHSIDLPEIDWRLRGQGLNLGDGFYWKPDGVYAFDGGELTFPFSKDKILYLD